MTDEPESNHNNGNKAVKSNKSKSTHKQEKQSILTRWRKTILRWATNNAEQEFHKILTETNNGDSLTEHERSLISAALQLDTVTADEIASVRSDIVSIPKKASFKTALKTFQSCHKSYLPITGENLDDVQGYLSMKDVLAFIGKERKFRISEVMRPAVFAPESVSIDRVLLQMKKHGVPLAVVVDEYGGTTGLLTLKDILSQLVGDIEDGDGNPEEPEQPKPLGEDKYTIDPRMNIENFRKYFNLPTPTQEDEFETVGGYVLSLAGRVPAKNESFKSKEGLVFTISQTDGRRLISMEVKRIS